MSAMSGIDDRSAASFFGSGTRNRFIRILAVVIGSASLMATECVPKGPSFFEPIDFVPGLGDIIGTVRVDSEGRAGVAVTLTRNGQQVRTTTTDGSGEYEFLNLEPGPYTVAIATIPGAECPGPRTALVPADGRDIVDFDCAGVPTTGTVTGRVFDQSVGNGIPGAQVMLNDEATSTDSNGNFTFEMVDPGAYGVTAEVQGYTCAARTTMVTAGQTSNVEIPCSPAVPTGDQIEGAYRLDGVGGENTCPSGNPFPTPGQTVSNPGPIEVRGMTSGGVTIITIRSNTMMAGELNTQTGEWTGTGTEQLSTSLDLRETTTAGRWGFEPSGTVRYNSGAELRFEVIDHKGTTDPGDDEEFCRAVVVDVQYTRLGDLTPSSMRFKTDVRSLLPGGMTLLSLRPVVFRYRLPWGDPAVRRVGLIAEEVAGVYPEAVAFDGGGQAMGIYYGTLRRLVIAEAVTVVKAAVAAGIARLAQAR